MKIRVQFPLPAYPLVKERISEDRPKGGPLLKKNFLNKNYLAETVINLNSIYPANLWYIIGYIATDGHLSKDGRHIVITSKDRRHIFAVRKAMGIKNKVGLKSRSNEDRKIYSYLQFRDVKFYNYLLKLGFVQNKSLGLGKIAVQSTYFADFVRGVIDGGGSITSWTHRSNLHKQWSLRITSAAPKFIKWLHRAIESAFTIKGKLYCYKYEDKKNNIYTLKFGKLASKVILKNVYYKNALALKRKNLTSVLCLQDKNKMLNYANVIGPDAETGRQPRLKIE